MNAPDNNDEKSKRLHILTVAEVDAIYGLPQFTAEDRAHFFSLTADEQAVLSQLHTLTSRIFFVLRLGYFKAVQQFFVFDLPEVMQDVHWIQQTHFPDGEMPTGVIAKRMRLKRQANILLLCDYRYCGELERRELASKAECAAGDESW